MATDKQRPDTFYVAQEITANSQQQFNIPVPVSPGKLEVVVQSANDSFFEIKANSLKNFSNTLRKDVKEYVKWIKWFCVNASIFPYKNYYQPDGKNYINYLPIISEDGQELITPARIHPVTHEIQISGRFFLPLSIPSRIVVLTHEIGHNLFDDDNETVPDRTACFICQKLGYTKDQIYNAFCEFMSNTPQNEMRKKDIYNYLFVNG